MWRKYFFFPLTKELISGKVLFYAKKISSVKIVLQKMRFFPDDWDFQDVSLTYHWDFWNVCSGKPFPLGTMETIM